MHGGAVVNAERRKQLDKVLEAVSAARADLESLRDEEQEYFDNMPESFQSGEKGQAAEAAIEAMEEAIGSLEEAEGTIETAKE